MTSGVLVMVVISIMMSYWAIGRANDGIAENEKNIKSVRELMIQGRQGANVRGNDTLGAVGVAITELKNTEKNIIGNLSDHRIIANQTRDNTLLELKKINDLVQRLLNFEGLTITNKSQ